MRKIALVTGATSGIGKAYAYALAKRGYALILTGRRQKEIQEVATRIREQYGTKVTICLVDFARDQEREGFMQYIRTQPIEFLVNNAGYGAERSFTEDSYHSQEAMIKVHILASVELCHIVATHMKAIGRGTIINVSSLASYLLLPKSAMYCATKSFLTSFTQSLGMELKDYGIKVQVLCPGFVHTDFHDKLAIDKRKCQNKGPVRWMDADALVKHSLEALDNKGQLLCIPGKWNQLGYHLLKGVPKKAYYKVVTCFSH